MAYVVQIEVAPDPEKLPEEEPPELLPEPELPEPEELLPELEEE